MKDVETMSIEELELYLTDLAILRDHTRSEMDKGELTCQIKIVTDQIAKLKSKVVEQEVVVNKDVPVRADHNPNQDITRGEVSFNDETNVGAILL